MEIRAVVRAHIADAFGSKNNYDKNVVDIVMDYFGTPFCPATYFTDSGEIALNTDIWLWIVAFFESLKTRTGKYYAMNVLKSLRYEEEYNGSNSDIKITYRDGTIWTIRRTRYYQLHRVAENHRDSYYYGPEFLGIRYRNSILNIINQIIDSFDDKSIETGCSSPVVEISSRNRKYSDMPEFHRLIGIMFGDPILLAKLHLMPTVMERLHDIYNAPEEYLEYTPYVPDKKLENAYELWQLIKNKPDVDISKIVEEIYAYSGLALFAGETGNLKITKPEPKSQKKKWWRFW